MLDAHAEADVARADAAAMAEKLAAEHHARRKARAPADLTSAASNNCCRDYVPMFEHRGVHASSSRGYC